MALGPGKGQAGPWKVLALLTVSHDSEPLGLGLPCENHAVLASRCCQVCG